MAVEGSEQPDKQPSKNSKSRQASSQATGRNRLATEKQKLAAKSNGRPTDKANGRSR